MTDKATVRHISKYRWELEVTSWVTGSQITSSTNTVP